MKELGAYKTWKAMRKRCNSPSATNYKYYGGKGIAICARWGKFENFYADMGDRPEGMSIDRIDVNLGYSPDNCRWATHSEQMANRENAPAPIILTHNDITGSLSWWAKELGIKQKTLYRRYARGLRGGHLFCSPRQYSSGQLLS